MLYDQKQEIIYSLPSKKILNVTSALAVINPITEELIILKQRSKNGLRSFVADLTKEEFEYYNEIHHWSHTYEELTGKNILIDFRLLNNRGIKVLIMNGFISKSLKEVCEIADPAMLNITKKKIDTWIDVLRSK